jgi:hypothetical protein
VLWFSGFGDDVSFASGALCFPMVYSRIVERCGTLRRAESAEMALIESIPLQEKIAELDRRIAKLEKAHGVEWVKTEVARTTTSKSEIFGEDWDKMWEHFHKVMKAAFR